MRARALWCCFHYGVLPWWLYEDECHYRPMGYFAHLWMNAKVAARWLTFRERNEDREFEHEINGSPLAWADAPAPALDLAAETEAYQALLEGHRRDPDNDELFEDLAKAAEALQVAWVMAGGGAR